MSAHRPPGPRWLALLAGACSCLAAPGWADVYVNEILADNPGRPQDPIAQLDMDGRSPGWVELHNDGTSPVTLTGWALSDDPAVPGKWVFAAPIPPAAAGTTIAAGGYKLVFCGGLERNVAGVEPHVSFQLDRSGAIRLSRPDDQGGWTVVSQMGGVRAGAYPAQRKAVSFGHPGDDRAQPPVFFEKATPAGANDATGFTAFCGDTVFSVDRGFYDTPFTLTLTSATPGATLVYTLNGTVPSATNGTQVPAATAETPPAAALTIAGTTLVRARAIKAGLGGSDVDTQTYIFPTEVLTQSGPLPSMGLTAEDTFPWGKSGDSLRAPPGPDWAVNTSAASYPNEANRLTTDDLKRLPVVSVVTAWREAFGPAASQFAATPATQRGFYIGAAAGVANEGADRAASFELINPSGDPSAPNPTRDRPDGPWKNKGFQVDGTVHVFGGTSQDRWKSYKLSMRFKGDQSVNTKVYGDEGVDRQNLFILDARLNQSWNHPDATQQARGDYVRDHVMADLQNAMGGLSFHTRPVHLFLNGLYWGLYILHEKLDEEFMAAYGGARPADWDIFKHSATGGVDGAPNAFAQVIATAALDPALALGSKASPVAAPFFNCTALKNYEDLLDRLGLGRVAPNPAVDLTQPEAYEAVAAKLDIPDFINYVLLNAVAANTDWPHKNYYASYLRTGSTGRWRFHSWDAEHVFRAENENTFTQSNWTADTSGAGAILRKLAVNAEFRLAFADAAQKHIFARGVLSTAGLQAAFNRRFAEIEPMGVRGESARWGDTRSPAGKPFSYLVNGTFTTPTWMAEKNRLLNTVLPARASLLPTVANRVINQLMTFKVGATSRPLYPATAAPEFRNQATHNEQPGGPVAAGFTLQITNPAGDGAGTIYYTLDGSDPREKGTGAVAAGAQTYAAPIGLVTSHLVRARILNGATWSALTDAHFSVDTEPAAAGNIVVSKLHYHPRDPSADESRAGFTDPDDFEFLELMNIGARTVDLTGARFGAGLDYTFDDRSGIREVAPGGRVLLVKNRAAFELRYGAGQPVAGEFAGATGLANGGERLHLLARNGDTIQEFTFSDEPPWPSEADGTGPALVLINPTSNPDPAPADHWRASTTDTGSPGADDRYRYATWIASSFTPAEAADPLVTAPDRDPDGDGIANGLEFAFGLLPKTPDGDAGLPRVRIATVAGEFGTQPYAVFVVRSRPGADDAVLAPSTSTTLDPWSEIPSDLVFMGSTPNRDGSVTRRYRTADPLSKGSLRFFRIGVTVAP